MEISIWNMDWTTIAVASIGFCGIFVTAFFSYLSQRAAREVNDAVNHRHKDQPKKLYDLAWENHQKMHILDQWRKDADKRMERIEDHIKQSCNKPDV